MYLLVILTYGDSDESIPTDKRLKAKRQWRRRAPDVSKLTVEEDAMGDPFDITLLSQGWGKTDFIFKRDQVKGLIFNPPPPPG